MARRVRSVKRKDPSEFFSSVSAAFFEWILIIILFLNALLSYLSVKFARYCKLPLPCSLCSRIDRFIEDSDPGTFVESLCDAHGSEVSSLAFCASHRRLNDARNMCGACLVSFADTMAALDRGGNGGEDTTIVPLLDARRCVCCSVPFESRSREKPIVVEPAFSLSGMAKAMEIPSRDHGFDLLSHVGYSEVKITSDSESEVLFSDADDNASTLARSTDNLKDAFVSRGLQPEPMTALPKSVTRAVLDDAVLEKPACPSPLTIPESSFIASEKKLNIGASNSSVDVGHGLEEINLHQVEVRSNPCVPSEVISEHAPQEGLNINLQAPEVDVANGEATKAFGSNDLSFKVSQIMNEKLSTGTKPPLPSSASTDLITGRESFRVSEDLKVRLSQISSSQWSEFPLNDAASSPRLYGQGDEPRLSDASSSTGILNYVKRYSIDRNESSLDSLEGSLVGDIEGESSVDRLKRQIEMDRKSMILLYKELEEERNASAIAANQAMAMINRLQEEKASMHMEALQYLRMMEEQTEYDQEALQKLNDLLADRDKEIQDLEAEVDSYRKQYGGEPLTSGVLEQLGDSEERVYREYTPVSTPRLRRSRLREIGSNIEKNTVRDFEDEKVYISECIKSLEKKLQLFANSKLSTGAPGLGVNEDAIPDKSSLVMENESRNDDYAKEPLGDEDQEYSVQDNGTLENSKKSEVTMSKDLPPSRDESNVINCFTPSSIQPVPSFFKEALKESTLRSLSYNERQFQMGSKRNDITALGNEISQLSARLEALEADRSFLDHAVDSLRNGSNGLQFIQEIACHLRELRKIGITYQQQAVA